MILEIAMEIMTLIDRCVHHYQVFGQIEEQCISFKSQLKMARVLVKGVEQHCQTRGKSGGNGKSDEILAVPLSSLRRAICNGIEILDDCSKKKPFLRRVAFANGDMDKLNQVRTTIDSAMIAIAASGMIMKRSFDQDDDLTIRMSESFSSSEASTQQAHEKVAALLWGLGNTKIGYGLAQEELNGLTSGDPITESFRALLLDPKYFKHPDIEKDITRSNACWKLVRAFGIESRASSLGDVWAQFFLGWMHSNGIVFSQDTKRAEILFEKAAQQNHAPSYFCLGKRIQIELGSSKENLLRAASLFKIAAKCGHVEALTVLGKLYRNGTGVDRDHARAFKYFKHAAVQNYPEAQYKLGTLLQHGRRQEIILDPREGLKYLLLSAKQNYAPAQNSVGYHYLNGINGVEQNFEIALKYFRSAAEQGDSSARTNIGFVYQHGMGVKQDPSRAIRHYKVAAEEDSGAQFILGKIYLDGLGTDCNKEKAVHYFVQAANQGHVPAREVLKKLKNLMVGGLDGKEASTMGRKYRKRTI